MRPLLSAGLVLLLAAPALAGPIGFSSLARTRFRDHGDRGLDPALDRMNAAGRVGTPDGGRFVDAAIGHPDAHTGLGTTATGTIPLISLPTGAFVLGERGMTGSGIFEVDVIVNDWAGARHDRPQGFTFAAAGEVHFPGDDLTRGELKLDFLGAGFGKGLDSLFSHYEFRLVSTTEDGVTRIDAEYTVTSLDGSPPVAAAPEPATLVSAGLGVVALMGAMRRRVRGPSEPRP